MGSKRLNKFSVLLFIATIFQLCTYDGYDKIIDHKKFTCFERGGVDSCVFYHRDTMEIRYVKGVLNHGSKSTFDTNGVIISRQFFVNGKKQGWSYYYDEHGDLLHGYFYKSDQPMIFIRAYENVQQTLTMIKYNNYYADNRATYVGNLFYDQNDKLLLDSSTYFHMNAPDTVNIDKTFSVKVNLPRHFDSALVKMDCSGEGYQILNCDSINELSAENEIQLKVDPKQRGYVILEGDITLIDINGTMKTHYPSRFYHQYYCK